MSPQASFEMSPPAGGKADTRSEVRRLLGYLFRRQLAEDELPSRPNNPEWDSLKHIELMFLLEDHFRVRFSTQQMADMEDLETIVRELEALSRA